MTVYCPLLICGLQPGAPLHFAALEIENDMIGKHRLAKDGGNRHWGHVQNDGLIDPLHPGETTRMRVVKEAAGCPKGRFELFKEFAGRQFFRSCAPVESGRMMVNHQPWQFRFFAEFGAFGQPRSFSIDGGDIA